MGNAEGLEQTVILGAGFDTMALWLQDKLRDVTIYEVDHPATQAAKRATLAKLSTPANVCFVAVDFEQDDFVEKLQAARFDSSHRTLVSWLGVPWLMGCSRKKLKRTARHSAFVCCTISRPKRYRRSIVRRVLCRWCMCE